MTGWASVPKQFKRIKKFRRRFARFSRKMDYKITIQKNMKTFDVLDVTLDINSRICKPFNNPNNTPHYINVLSNHPPSVKKNIPWPYKTIISKNSSNRAISYSATPLY